MRPVDQGPRGREIPHRLGQEGPGQRVAVVAKAPLHRRRVQHGDEPAVRLARRANLIGEERQKFPLEPVPGI